MKITKVGVSVGRKISDGDYGSHDSSTWAEADIDPTEDVEAAMNSLHQQLTGKTKEYMSIQYVQLKKGGK